MADQTEKILFQLQLDVDALVGNTQKAKDKLAELKVESTSLNKALDDLKKSGVTSGATFDNLRNQITANTAAQQNATTKVRDYEKQLRLAVAANDAQLGSIDQMKARLSILTAEWNALSLAGRTNTVEGKALAESIDLTTEELNKQEQSVGNFRRQIGNYEVATKSLRQQIKDAKDEATSLAAQFGINSTQATKATQKVADLTEELGDFNKRVAALNPEQKFAAFAQVAGSVAGGISAAQGAMALFGSEGENTQKALLKVQAAMAFASGLNQLAELADGFKNLKLVIGLSTIAKQADNAATVEGEVVTQGATVSLAGFASAEGIAAVGSQVLGAALKVMMGPLGFIILAAGAAVAAFELLGGDGGKKQVDKLTSAIQDENEAHKKSLDTLKLRNAAIASGIESELSLAKARGESEEKIGEIQNRLINERKIALGTERVENINNLQALTQQWLAADRLLSTDLDKDQRDRLTQQRDHLKEEVDNVKKRNGEILIEQKKLDSDLLIAQQELTDKRNARVNAEANQRISLIKDDRARELAQESEALKEQTEQLSKQGLAAIDQIANAKAISAQKQREINLKFDLQELQERNKAAIAITKEGSDERLVAEINALKTEGAASIALIIGNGKLEKEKRIAIKAETDEKIIQLEQQRVDRINAIDKENSDNLISLLNEQSNAFLQQKLNQIAIEERIQVEAAKRNGENVSLVEARFNKLRLDAQNQFNDARIQAENDLQNKILQAKLINTPQGSDEQTRLLLEQENNSFQQLSDTIHRHQNEKIKDAENSLKAELLIAGDSQDQQLAAWDNYYDALKNANDNSNADIEIATQNHLKNIEDITAEGVNNAISRVQDVFNSFLQIANNILDIGANADADRLQQLQDSGDARKEEIQSQLDALHNQNQGALTAQQIQEKKYAEEIKAIDKDLAAQRKATAKKEADEKKEIQKEAALVDFVLGSAKIGAATAEAVAKAVAASPITFGQPFAGFAIANGIIQELILATQTAKVLSLYEGGFTGPGNPRDVSLALGSKPYEYHKEEYVVDHQTLRHPIVFDFIKNFVEPMRTKNGVPASSIPGRFTGGLADASQVINNFGAGVSADQAAAIAEASAKAVMKNLPPIVTVVQDVTEAQGIVTKVADRANVFRT